MKLAVKKLKSLKSESEIVDEAAFKQVDPGYAVEVNDIFYIRCKNCSKTTKFKPDPRIRFNLHEEIAEQTGFIEHPSEDYEENDWNRDWYCSTECAVLEQIAK